MPLDQPPPSPRPGPPTLRTEIATLAVGEAPAWRLDRDRDMLLLVETGQPVVRATGISMRQTPRGTLIEARTAEGATLTIRVAFGACRLASSGRSTSHLAHVTLRDRHWQGCFLRAPQGEKPLID